jgi:hypothetical protein
LMRLTVSVGSMSNSISLPASPLDVRGWARTQHPRTPEPAATCPGDSTTGLRRVGVSAQVPRTRMHACARVAGAGAGTRSRLIPRAARARRAARAARLAKRVKGARERPQRGAGRSGRTRARATRAGKAHLSAS